MRLFEFKKKITQGLDNHNKLQTQSKRTSKLTQDEGFLDIVVRLPTITKLYLM